MWKLVIEDDEGKRTVVPLTRDDYTVGRKEGNTIRLTERNVSREHAKIRKATNGAAAASVANGGSPFVLEDLTSYNGVYVNGLRVAQPQGLQHGDLIQIGDYRIVIQDDAVVEDASAMATTTQDMKSTMPTGAAQRGAQLMERPNRFVMLAGPTPGAEYSLDQERVTIGRAEDCTISINHNSVSRLHCEVHALGDGRFEIIDKGSSNGVRVNGSDLRRGIVEPGDILELGDVRFRFVGAGQIFIPTPGDATTQLETIGDRPPSSPRSERGRPSSGGSVVPWVLVGALFAVILVGGFAYWQRMQGQTNGVPSATTTTTTAVPEDKEQLALQAAKKLCESGDCEAAHDKLVVSIADHSPLQQSPDYQNIETRWADILLERADKEKDLAKKRALYHQVEATATVPQSRRDIATAKLQEIDAQNGGTRPNQLPTATASAPTGIATGTATTHPTGTTTASTHPTATATTTTTTTATATTKPSGGGSVAEQARGMMLNNNPSGARSILEPRVFAKKATAEEAGLLWDACKAMRDKQCRDTVDQLYPGNPHH
jgi:pSer/pThr/pTyr-binding forkhead associated (FHA) protein